MIPIATSNTMCVRDRLYLSESGNVFTSASYVAVQTSPYYGSILFTCDGEPFEITIGGRKKQYRFVALRPGVTRAVCAGSHKLVCIQISPRQAAFRGFAAIGGAGLMELDVQSLAPFDRLVDAAYCGALSCQHATELLNGVVSTTARRLPQGRAIDSRTTRMLELLDLRSDCSVSELSRTFGISLFRMSHLFGACVGISFRTYKRWQRMHEASRYMGAGMSLTEIANLAGFSSLSHFGRDFREVFGVAPSRLLLGNQARVVNWRSWAQVRNVSTHSDECASIALA